MKWFRDWQERRRQRQVFEALFALAMMDIDDGCFWCEGDPANCICDDYCCESCDCD